MRENVRELIAILMNSPFYLTLSVRERYGLVLRLIEESPILAGRGDTNLKGSISRQDSRAIPN